MKSVAITLNWSFRSSHGALGNHGKNYRYVTLVGARYKDGSYTFLLGFSNFVHRPTKTHRADLSPLTPPKPLLGRSVWVIKPAGCYSMVPHHTAIDPFGVTLAASYEKLFPNLTLLQLLANSTGQTSKRSITVRTLTAHPRPPTPYYTADQYHVYQP